MRMLHGMFKVVLQLFLMCLLLIQLPLSVIEFEREDRLASAVLCRADVSNQGMMVKE
ncbi:unnamed protein product [Prunus brigantina]